MLNLRKKLLVSIFTLMLALVAVSTTTYAWFTLGTDVSVDGIEMSVEGSDGLYIRVVSVNGKNDADGISAVNTFQSDVDLTDLLQDISLIPLTKQSNGLVELVEQDGLMAPNAAADAGLATDSQQYIHIEFELSSASPLDVYFSSLSVAVSESAPDNYTFPTSVALGEYTYTDLNNRQMVVGSVAEGGVVTAARLANSLRIAYSAAAATEVTEAVDGSTAVRTYPATNYHQTLSANIIAPSIYDATVLDTESVQYGTWERASTEYYNKISDVQLKSIPEYKYCNVQYEGENVGENGTLVPLNQMKVITLGGNPTQGYYAKVTLTIWLEGYDADCFNAILKDFANISLSFNGVKAA